ncbi:hypothetical protein BegalDRAFT_2657 [Beggiatoa alba B18LD]|uniref:Uncharacterized protein n=1 Tax=Beggiatoa alba B18LD TaxID=395493 RepID=I3CIQ5_9GAMM|nr:hypothetical protein [Beggiatoa alba]EIJ43498.1 hypothetical protein BegalDRAFT_2657 [Beggiatoa alba B18LD]
MMITPHPAALWAQTTPFSPIDIDCVTAVMLKILDSKCKMGQAEQIALAAIYDVVKDQQGELLDSSLHPLIASARQQHDEALLTIIHAQRVHAESVIPKPTMKAFKQRLRNALMPNKADSEIDDDD